MLFSQDQYCIVDNQPLSPTNKSLYCSKKCELLDAKFKTPKNQSRSGKLITYSTRIPVAKKKLIEAMDDDCGCGEMASEDSVFELDDDLSSPTDIPSNFSTSARSSVSSFRSNRSSLPSLLSDVGSLDMDDDASLYSEPRTVEVYRYEWLYDAPTKTPIGSNQKPTPALLEQPEEEEEPAIQENSESASWGYELSLANNASYSLKTDSILGTLMTYDKIYEKQDQQRAELQQHQRDASERNYRLYLNQIY